MNPKISPEQRRALDEHGGQPIVVVDPERQQRFVLIANTDYRVRDLVGDPNGDGEWTDEKEARRRDLIDKDIAGTITDDEKAELAILDRQGNEHYDRIAPRPTILGGDNRQAPAKNWRKAVQSWKISPSRARALALIVTGQIASTSVAGSELPGTSGDPGRRVPGIPPRPRSPTCSTRPWMPSRSNRLCFRATSLPRVCSARPSDRRW